MHIVYKTHYVFFIAFGMVVIKNRWSGYFYNGYG